GYAKPGAANWALVGDLTALYDLQGPWILPQLLKTQVNLVIMNNGGGKIFAKMFPQQEFQNNHHLRFSALADLWSLDYLKWDVIPASIANAPEKNRIIEIIPDELATQRFWERYQCL
ncbi:MAG: 2-succinyl-5-enolpyruvyl-6-hydroxy-3-cyclohexene-1-carboxylic-acid synthase, partial [Bdellovibrionia bacterium]